MFNKHLQSEKINNIAEEPTARFLLVTGVQGARVSPDRSHVLKAGQSQLRGPDSCALLPPPVSPTPSMVSS